MVFSSFAFLFLFFPIFFLCYYLLSPVYRNALILLASLLFYAIGEGHRTWILVLSIVANYGVGYIIGQTRTARPPLAKAMLILGIAVNLGLLTYFKYSGFLTANVDRLTEVLGLGALVPVLHIALPLGISFFAFQGISYLMDVYRGDIRPTSSLLKFGTYKAMFPQLIAGPIVRYAHIVDDLPNREVEVDRVFLGAGRFCRGLAKKVLIADTVAQTADLIFGLPADQLGMQVAWLGVLAYSVQIYFDFSGYSDMAIGMGQMMGFRYPENFNHPYTSRSIGEFWRRWHMTLSSWFRDYVYIPLGGNRKGSYRTYLNLLCVFALTGLWHGASWTFVIWGLWHGLFMLLERRYDPSLWRVPLFLRHLYVIFVVMIGWTLFRADSAEVASRMFTAMFGFGDRGPYRLPVAGVADGFTLLVLLVGLVCSAPVYRRVMDGLPQTWRNPVNVIGAMMVICIAGTKVLSGAYSPFLYFRF